MTKFVSPFAKATLASLLIVHFVTLRPVFPFCLAQFVQVFLPKPASFCKLSAGLDGINKVFIFPFLFFNSRSVFVTLSFPSFLFTSISSAYLAATVFSLILYYRASMGPRTFVSLGQRCSEYDDQTWCPAFFSFL